MAPRTAASAAFDSDPNSQLLASVIPPRPVPYWTRAPRRFAELAREGVDGALAGFGAMPAWARRTSLAVPALALVVGSFAGVATRSRAPSAVIRSAAPLRVVGV